MFDDFSIVSTAISSFNNAALFGPFFFAVGLLSIPLFYFVYIYGKDLLTRWNWKGDIDARIGFWSVLFLVLWILLFGGNYAVMRDGISVLSLMIAIVLFVSIVFVVKNAKKLQYLMFFKDKKHAWIAFVGLLLLGFISAKPDLYGILLQLSAILCGIIVGSRLHNNSSELVVSSLIFGTMTTLVLMQPEFFRFGQLGDLTVIHLLGILITGFFAVTTLITKYAKPKSKIYESAYIKLKWLFRILAALAFVLFVSTESVPVFLGLIAAIGLSEFLTVYHSKHTDNKLYKQSWAMLLISFGVIIICPVITCLGLIYLANMSKDIKFKDFTGLL